MLDWGGSIYRIWKKLNIIYKRFSSVYYQLKIWIVMFLLPYNEPFYIYGWRLFFTHYSFTVMLQEGEGELQSETTTLDTIKSCTLLQQLLSTTRHHFMTVKRPANSIIIHMVFINARITCNAYVSFLVLFSMHQILWYTASTPSKHFDWVCV